MHEVAAVDLEEFYQPAELFSQTNKVNPMELSNDETTHAKDHRNNGATLPNGTQPYSPNSTLIDA